MAWRRAEFHLRARFQIVERGGSCGEKSLAHGFGARADFGGEKFARVVERVRNAVALRLAGAWNPHRAGRCRRRAADLIGLLAQQNIEAFERGDQGGRHAAHAGAENQNVDLAVPAHQIVGMLPVGAA